MATSSQLTTSKRVWWSFLLFVPLLAVLLLSVGAPALPVSLIATAIPIYVTHRLLQSEWRSRRVVTPLFVLSVVAAVVIVFTDPSKSTAMYIPYWVSTVLGFYFLTAPLVMTAFVLVELHRVNWRG
jgi:hypothetical protein